ncbi:type II toxin-antitoxin system RelE/ParE family toxin [Pelobium manganitolerans]|uniref:type II toxin-antitoxin system RelE/ParE family toxin n=1 Tax=Pelobium manganitolerans TaxID=1842495 RepID=UPI003FA3C29F
MAYKLSVKARDDIEKIWFYTYTNWSKQQADQYIELIFAEIHHITQDLNRGKSYENLRDGYRGVKIQSHIIFFRLAKRVGNK